MNSKRISITECIIKEIILFSIISVVRGIAVFENINKIWIAVISVTLLLRLMNYRFNLEDFSAMALTVVIHIIAIFFTDFPIYNGNMLFYFLLWVMIYFYFAKSKNKIEAILYLSDRFINFVLWIWTILVGVSAFLPGCYDSNYFGSFAGSSFRLMPATLIITALAMYMAIKKQNHRYELFLILPVYAGFMNESRTYFGVFILFLLMYLYIRFKSKRNFYIMLIPIIVVIIMLMTVSGIADKLRATQYTETSYYDYWGTITSGRTVFWRWDIEAFLSLPFWQQFVGNGFNFVYDVTLKHYSIGLWAHNDVINILMNFGYIGVAIYFWVYFKMIKAFWPKGNKIPFVVKILFQSAVFLNSMMNMSYTYVCAMISYPLFLCAISAKYDRKLNA